MKLLDITKFFGETTGGIRTYLLEKAKHVARRADLSQVVIIPAELEAITSEGHTRWYRLASRPIPTQSPYRFLLARKRIGAIIGQERPDIIEVGSPYFVPWITRRAAAPFNIPLIWFFHTNFPRIICPLPSRGGLARRVAGGVADRYVVRLARVFDGAIGASRVAVNALEQAGFQRVEHIPLGVSLELFHPGRRRRVAETRAVYGIPAGPVAIYTGRLAREKELGLIIDAWPRVEKATGATLVLVGDGPSRHFFQRQCRASRVVWLPYERDRERLADLLAAADIYLAPGPAETFGLGALEAMASGLPVVSSDQGAVRELVEASGAGVVNPDPDAEVMAASIIGLLGSDCTELGLRGRRYAEAHHSWEPVFDRLFGFYRRVVAESHA